MDLRQQLLTKYEVLVFRNQELMNTLIHLTPDELHFKSRVNTWSIIQVLNHVRNAEMGTLKYVLKKLKYGGMKNPSWSAGLRAFLMRTVNNSSIKFKMPSALSPPSPEGTLSSVQEEWQELRKEWKDLLINFPEDQLHKAVFRHPIFGRLSFLQTIDSMISHQDHHKKQIIRIKKTINLKKPV